MDDAGANSDQIWFRKNRRCDSRRKKIKCSVSAWSHKTSSRCFGQRGCLARFLDWKQLVETLELDPVPLRVCICMHAGSLSSHAAQEMMLYLVWDGESEVSTDCTMLDTKHTARDGSSSESRSRKKRKNKKRKRSSSSKSAQSVESSSQD